MRDVTNLGNIAVSGEIAIPAAVGSLHALIAAELKIDPKNIQYVDDLTPQGGGLFAFDYYEGVGTRIPGADYFLKKAKVVTNSKDCFVKSAAGAFQCDFIAYVDQLPQAN